MRKICETSWGSRTPFILTSFLCFQIEMYFLMTKLFLKYCYCQVIYILLFCTPRQKLIDLTLQKLGIFKYVHNGQKCRQLTFEFLNQNRSTVCRILRQINCLCVLDEKFGLKLLCPPLFLFGKSSKNADLFDSF